MTLAALQKELTDKSKQMEEQSMKVKKTAHSVISFFFSFPFSYFLTIAL